ncbi:MAG: caspase family protein [Deltaproteobacteria bacterium]
MKLLLAMLLAAQASQGKKIALVAGIDTFADDAWPALRYAEKDARDVAAALADDFDEVRTIEGIVTRGRLEAELAALEATSDYDTVVVYLSTHGTLAYDDAGQLDRVLVLHDTTKTDPRRTGLAYGALTARLERIRARQKLVILAACHSGAGKSKLDPGLAAELSTLKDGFFSEPHLVTGEGQIILAASAFGETAREDVTLENDIYTHFFLKALDAAFDLDEDGAITALEAHHYARRETIAYTAGKQRPTLTAEVVGVDPIVLRGRRVRLGRPMIAGFSGPFVGARLEVDGREKGVLPGTFVIEDGARRVRVFRPGAAEPMFDEIVDADAGAVVVLDDRVRREATPWRVYAGGGYAAVRGEVGRRHLPGYFVVGAGARYALQERVGIGASIYGTQMGQNIRLLSGDGVEVAAPQTIGLVQVSGDVAVQFYSVDWADVAARVHAGWIAGRRRVEVSTVSDPDHLVSHPFFGVALEGTAWPHPMFGVRAEVAVDLSLPQVDGDLRPTFGDRYGLGGVARF